MTIGDRFLMLRKALKVNQSKIAMVMGCCQSNISYFEKDGSTLAVKYLIPLRNAYNVNIDWLLTGAGDMFLADTGIFQNQKDPAEVEQLKQNIDTLYHQIDILKKKNAELTEELLSAMKKLNNLYENCPTCSVRGGKGEGCQP